MIRLGAYDLLGRTVRIRSSAPLADHLATALADLSCADRRRARTLTVESFADGTWSVSWPDAQRYDGPDASVALSDVFGALNDAAARQAASNGLVGLHGGTVRVRDTAVALVGHSGAGKSTLTAGLVRAGHGFIADELCAVELVGETIGRRPVVHPYHRPIGLRVGGAEALGIEIPDGPFDHTFPLRAASLGAPVGATPLGLLVFVVRDPHVLPAVSEVSAAQALHRLSNHTLGTWDVESATFPRLDRLVREVRAVEVRYATLDDGVALVEGAATVASAS